MEEEKCKRVFPDKGIAISSNNDEICVYVDSAEGIIYTFDETNKTLIFVLGDKKVLRVYEAFFNYTRDLDRLMRELYGEEE